MARPGISYEQVADVANKLMASGFSDPSAKAVRDELAKRARPGEVGSPNTIQRHLVAWRKQRPVSLTESGVLPSQLAGDLARALTAAADVARETAEGRLALLQVEHEDLLAVGEANEVRLEQISQELSERTSQRDEVLGKLEERTGEVARLQAELASARSTVQEALQRHSAAQATEQAAVGRVAEIREVADRTRAELQAQLEEARGAQDAATDRAHQAEQRAAAAEARLEAVSAGNKTLEEHLSNLSSSVKGLAEAAARTAAAEGAVTSLQEQNSLLQQTNALLQSMVKAAGGLGS